MMLSLYLTNNITNINELALRTANIFDPSKIILAGARLSFDYLYSDKLIEEMRQWVVQVDAPLPEVIVHDWGDLMWAKGAAAYALEEVTARTVRELANAAA